MEQTHSFGYWLRRQRKALDLTQEELAQQVGCAVSTIKKLESDERRPSKQLTARLAELLSVPPTERASFLKAARGEQSIDQLPLAHQPLDAQTGRVLPADGLPSGTLTFLFTDIEHSSRLWADAPLGMGAALARHDAILRQVITARHGHVFKAVGDGFCAVFTSPTNALIAALKAQQELCAESWSTLLRAGQGDGPPRAGSPTLRVRVALHTGTVELRDGDYFGHALSRIARILAAGHGGQILLSAATWELVRDQLPPDVTLRNLGAHWLRGVSRPEQIFQLDTPDLPSIFPPLTAQALPRSNLPIPSTAIIGREREVARARELLHQPDVRLLTLTGPGGTGKTRLAIEAANSLLTSDASATPAGPAHDHEEQPALFPDGVWFVDLAPVSEPALLPGVVARALDLREHDALPPLNHLKRYLHGKRTLLVLDNFEQLLAATPLIAELLAATHGLKLLITSRTPLRLSGEQEFAVPPLGLPDLSQTGDLAQVTQYDAVRLFITRAQAVKAAFAVTNASAAAVAEICHRLDGLPLAIELAAARVKLFSPQALLSRLSDRLTFLTGGPRDMPARQQTLRNTINWSYQLLDEGERQLFARLSVFVSGCTLEAAEVVCRGADHSISVVDGVAALLDKSLVYQTDGPDGEPRIGMLETVREFALERLVQSGDAAELRSRHADHFCALAEMAEPYLYSSDQVLWLDRLEAEHDNLRAVLRWSLATGAIELGLRVAAVLERLWNIRDYWREGWSWMEQLLTRQDEVAPAVRAKALWRAALLANVLAATAETRRCLEESLTLFRELGDRHGIAVALSLLAWQAFIEGDWRELHRIEEELEELFGALEDPWVTAFVLLWRALDGAIDEQQRLLQASLAGFQQVGDRWGIAFAAHNLGATAWELGDDEQARRYLELSGRQWRALGQADLGSTALGFVLLRQNNLAGSAACFATCLRSSLAAGNRSYLAESLSGMGCVAARLEEPVLAARLLGACDALFRAIGQARDPFYVPYHEQYMANVRAQLGADEFAAAYAAGQTATLEEAVADGQAVAAAAD